MEALAEELTERATEASGCAAVSGLQGWGLPSPRGCVMPSPLPCPCLQYRDKDSMETLQEQAAASGGVANRRCLRDANSLMVPVVSLGSSAWQPQVVGLPGLPLALAAAAAGLAGPVQPLAAPAQLGTPALPAAPGCEPASDSAAAATGLVAPASAESSPEARAAMAPCGPGMPLVPTQGATAGRLGGPFLTWLSLPFSSLPTECAAGCVLPPLTLAFCSCSCGGGERRSAAAAGGSATRSR